MTSLPRAVLISRTDSIGDVVLTLPVAVALKRQFPGVKIGFIGRSYTRAVIEACESVDRYVDAEQFLQEECLIDGLRADVILHVFPQREIAVRAKGLGIPKRIGTTNRLWHWCTCNNLVRLSRKNSNLHESQLNLKLLAGLGIRSDYSIEEISGMPLLGKTQALQPQFAALLEEGRKHVVFHAKSAGSAREWGLENFLGLARLLELEGGYQVFISGTEKEREALKPLLDAGRGIVRDITGLMPLAQFMAFIAACDALVAGSTGPLHIAAAQGISAIGIYPPIRPMHPGRWAPLGKVVRVLVAEKTCSACRKDPTACACMRGILPSSVAKAIAG